MAILGTFVDRALSSRAGDALRGVTLTTLSHSLPATGPEMMVPVLQSIQDVGAANPVCVMFGIRGNASLNTVGFAVPSTGSAPTVSFENYSIVFHSLMR